MTDSFRLKGWHVLATLLGFFGAVIAANAVFVNFAVRSFPGQDVEKSYLQGLHFNDELAAKERQAALRWSARLEVAERAGDRAVIEIAIASSSGEPVSGLAVGGVLRRPASEKEDRKLEFSSVGSGRYRAEASGLAPGAYDLRLTARSVDDGEFKLAKRLLLK
jgi:nitrogen fixation protein FixH